MIEYKADGSVVDHGATSRHGEMHRSVLKRQTDLIAVRRQLEKGKYRTGAAFIERHKEKQGEKDISSRTVTDPYARNGPRDTSSARETFKPGPYVKYWTKEGNAVTQMPWTSTAQDYARYDAGNCFRTEEEARSYVRPQKSYPYRAFNPKLS